MATFTQLRPDIWENPDYRPLSPSAKLVYLLLISHRKLSRCGVLDLMPARWATATGLSVDQVNAALDELAATRFVLIDWDTSELAVRSKVKHSPPNSWQHVKAVWKAWDLIESPSLRRNLAAGFPQACWEQEKMAPAPIPRPVENGGGCSDQPKHTHTDTQSDTPSDTHTDTQSDWGSRVTEMGEGRREKGNGNPSSPVVPSPGTADQPDDDQEHQLEQLARADLARRTTEKGPVANEPAWLDAAIAGHRKRLELDPDYLERRTSPPQPQPSPLDNTAAAAAALRARHMAELEADRGNHRPPPDIAATAIADARNALHRESGSRTAQPPESVPTPRPAPTTAPNPCSPNSGQNRRQSGDLTTTHHPTNAA